ncbi:MAG: glycosyltransferase family 39 protein [Rhodospirillaceae bacterium]|nr:glycosyltransferase family 39 protein [Rhodospirillaceae bacterium]MDE0616892.1 glycosyltransferase family 39 protein [Rhodospirillaceae bacterium]
MLTGYRAWLWLVLLCAALYLPGLASLPAMDRDESRFMQASRQMAQTGDTIRIRFLNKARNKKPAGIHWMQAASVKLLSTPESTALWPYRLPSVLGATAAVLFAFALGLLFLDRRGAFLASALLASSFVLVVEAHTAKTDAVLLGAIVAAQYALARIYLDGRSGAVTGWRIAILFWAALAVGILIKGPVPVAVVFLTLAALLVTDRQARFWRGLRPPVGLPLLLLIAAPWYLAIILADDTFLREAGGRDFLGKLLTAQEQHGAPPGAYALILVIAFAPASLFVWQALRWSWTWRREAAVRFCLCWILPFWLVLELTPTKLPHYILPTFPALALLIAMAVRAAEAGEFRWLQHWASRTLYIAGLLLIGGFAVLAFLLPIVTGNGFVWAGLVPILAVVAVSLYTVPRLWRGEIRAALLASAFAAPLVFAPVLSAVAPAVNQLWISREIGRKVAALDLPAGTRFFASGYTEPSLAFYLGSGLRLTSPAALGAGLPEQSWLAVIRDDRVGKFRDAMARRGLAVRAVATVSGLNYSRGRRTTVTLFRPARPDGR